MLPRLVSGDALLLVDPQNDFCPGGALPVPDGDQIMPVLNDWIAAAEQAGVPIFVSRDWHPPRTTHFKDFGGVWPVHCVAGTRGAEFHSRLRIARTATIVSKGMGEDEDAYSAFQARDEAGTLLAELLRPSPPPSPRGRGSSAGASPRGRGSSVANFQVRRLYVMGLATDYCVKASAIAGVADGFEVIVVRDGVRAVNLQPDDGDNAIDAMRQAGAAIA